MSRVSQARSLGKYFLLVDNMLVVLGFNFLGDGLRDLLDPRQRQ